MGCVQAWSAHGDLWLKNLASYSGKLGWAGRERYVREMEEMRKQQGGMKRAPSVILHHWWLGEALKAD
jgi:hypothetical protein